jgi:1,2-diacylglycerol 3-alpha-glucosyltransferase
MRLAYIVHRVGPYHHARFMAARELGDLIVIELSGEDRTYEWDKVLGIGQYERITVFAKADAAEQPGRLVRRATREALSRCRPDVVAIPGWAEPYALAALEWCLEFGVPALVLSASQAIDKPRARIKERVKAAIIPHFASAFVAGTPQREYLATLGMPRRKIYLGYDAVDNDHFRNGAVNARSQGDALRRHLKLPDKYFLAVARFVPVKNLERLIMAHARYAERVGTTAWPLVLLGDGPMRSTLEDLRQKESSDSLVTFHGFVQYADLPTYYGLSSAFILPSISEPWGLVVNEAMASGVAVLVSRNCGCAQDLVKPGETGCVFDPEDVNAIAAVMRDATSGVLNMSSMGLEAAKLVADWGLARFAGNLWESARTAVSSTKRRTSLAWRVALRAMQASKGLSQVPLLGGLKS